MRKIHLKKTILLIIIFTLSFSISCKSNQINEKYETIKITLPGQNKSVQNQIIITVKPDYTILLNQQKTPKKDLLTALKQIVPKDKSTTTEIACSENIKFSFIVEIMDIIKEAKITTFVLKIQ